MKYIPAITVFLLLALSCNTTSTKQQSAEPAGSYIIQKKATGGNGAVVSAHPLAS